MKIVSTNALDAEIKVCCSKCGEPREFETESCWYCEEKKEVRMMLLYLVLGIFAVSLIGGFIYHFHEFINSFFLNVEDALVYAVDALVYAFDTAPMFVQGFLVTFLILVSLIVTFALHLFFLNRNYF